jgi:hypothetical protein
MTNGTIDATVTGITHKFIISGALRGDGKHYYVKIGNRESMYAAVAVR